ncbi:MAG TPA: right-handed parallel beta-helix repeat-containing protein [Thermoplasmata archaeon]|nr:right-handed parallel beta-helix repeat-containing protein [Thermoplasmata archaeon]
MSQRLFSTRNIRGLRWAPIFGLCALLLTGYLAVGAAQAGAPKHATLKVPSQYSTIQGAIDAAHAGDTILVGAGTYTESLVVNTSVTILGAGPSKTLLQGPLGSNVVVSIGNGATVRFSGFTVTTANLLYADAIFTHDGANGIIYGNTIRAVGNNSIGIEVSYVSSATITSNLIIATSSPYVGWQVGIAVLDLSQATIRYNTIVGPGFEAVFLFASTATVTNNVMGDFSCFLSVAYAPCGTSWLNDFQGGGVVDYLDLGATTISNNLIYAVDDGVQMAGGSPGVAVNGNLILNSANYGLACFDQVCSYSHDVVIGGQYGIGVAATSVVTSATLDHVVIGGVTTPFYYEADFGMPTPTIGGTYTVL